ncbi:MAG: nucleotidyltransferase domain-containing protein [Elusimicrobia bacterium]|nr:nucleotidyltransferase domain-containing protein [Elusimicrobiota bacterium]
MPTPNPFSVSSKKETVLDLKPRHLQLVKEIMARFAPEFKVVVFGSRANGTAKPYSDLDLAIITQKPLPLRRIRQLREAFSNSRLPFKVDIVDWADTADHFRQIIKKGARPLNQ